MRYERSKQSVSIVSSFRDNRNFVTKSPAALKLRPVSQDVGGAVISASYNFCNVFGRCPTASKTAISVPAFFSSCCLFSSGRSDVTERVLGIACQQQDSKYGTENKQEGNKETNDGSDNQVTQR
ncbi:hypothetical protein Tsp_07266 [Trichinella spiralis]|uniref:hypothetical protein n=1 Tax=Trichinella spiralis TaxID=6334 RepID=UPI0001EFC337|nr:hypothetical protein Tsp_07266 [Trichinella spiralis]